MKKTRFCLSAVLSLCFLVSGCARLGGSGSSSAVSTPAVSQVEESKSEFHPIHPALNEGVPGEIDFGDPAARTEIADGIYDLNPTVPCTLEERKAALLEQLDFSRCDSIILTLVYANGVGPGRMDGRAALFEEHGLEPYWVGPCFLSDDGRLFYFSDYIKAQSCLNGCVLDAWTALYPISSTAKGEVYLKSPQPLQLELFYYGDLPADGNLSGANLRSITRLGWTGDAQSTPGSAYEAERIRAWIDAADAEQLQLLSYDEAMVRFIQKMGWAGFSRGIDEMGRPYYTDGEIRICGGSFDEKPCRFSIYVGFERDGRNTNENNALTRFRICVDGTEYEGFSVEEHNQMVQTYMEWAFEDRGELADLASLAGSASERRGSDFVYYESFLDVPCPKFTYRDNPSNPVFNAIELNGRAWINGREHFYLYAEGPVLCNNQCIVLPRYLLDANDQPQEDQLQWEIFYFAGPRAGESEFLPLIGESKLFTGVEGTRWIVDENCWYDSASGQWFEDGQVLEEALPVSTP